MKLPLTYLKNIQALWTEYPNNGLEQEARFYRRGLVGQPGSALTLRYSIADIANGHASDKYLGYVPTKIYKIDWECVFDKEWLVGQLDPIHLGEGMRLDAIASWQRSVLERRRQNRKLTQAVDSEFVKTAVSIAQSLRNEQRDYMQAFASFILQQGDWSEGQFLKYVIAHKTSSLAGVKWSRFYSKEGDVSQLTDMGREAYHYFTRTVRSLAAFMLKDSLYKEGGFFDTHVIDPKAMYPALRARPGDLTSEENLVQDLLKGEIKVSKYRDRNAAGVWVISQLGWPIYRDDLKKKMYNTIYSMARKYMRCPSSTPEEEGAGFFKRLSHKGWTYYDTSNAEKLEGYICTLPFRTCLSERGREPKIGDTKISGTTTTRTDMFWAESIMHNAAYDLGWLTPDNKLLGGGDNFATTKKVDFTDELSEYFAPAGRMLGFTHVGETGLKIVRDGAKTAIGIRNRFGGYFTENKFIPGSSLAHVCIALGLTSVDYWRLFDTIDWELSDFEAGGPHKFLHEKAVAGTITEQTLDLWHIAFEEIESYLTATATERIGRDDQFTAKYVYSSQGIPSATTLPYGTGWSSEDRGHH